MSLKKTKNLSNKKLLDEHLTWHTTTFQVGGSLGGRNKTCSPPCSFLNLECERGSTINFVSRRYTKGVPFLPKMVYKRDLRAEPPRVKLFKVAPPPRDSL